MESAAEATADFFGNRGVAGRLRNTGLKRWASTVALALL